MKLWKPNLRARLATWLLAAAALLLLAFTKTIISSLYNRISGWPVAGCRNQADVAALHRAVLRADLSLVQRVVEHDPGCVNAADKADMTALHFTVARMRVSPSASIKAGPGGGDWACMAQTSFTTYDLEDLRERGPGNVHINTATTVDYAPFAEFLISHGANVEARTRALRRTPLHMAMLLGHRRVAEVLLAHGADIKAADVNGLTPIHITAMSGNIAMAQLALSHGADPNAKVATPFGLYSIFGLAPFQDDTPLALATLCKRLDMVEFLLAHGADPNIKLREGFTVLQMASPPEIAKALIEHGAQAEGRGHEERTPLWQAVMMGNTETAQLLLSRGADTESTDKNGNTSLIAALRSTPELKREEMVALLLRHHARVNVRDSEGGTPLHIAVRRGQLSLVRMLLNAGADINARNRWQHTPLHLAVEEGDRAMVECLLARGAEVNARDDHGRTPLYYTWGGSAKDREIAKILALHGGH